MSETPGFERGRLQAVRMAEQITMALAAEGDALDLIKASPTSPV